MCGPFPLAFLMYIHTLEANLLLGRDEQYEASRHNKMLLKILGVYFLATYRNYLYNKVEQNVLQNGYIRYNY